MTRSVEVRLATLLAVLPLAAIAQPPRTRPATPVAPATSSLPISRVALYKNGVGFFEHVGQVHGNERVTIDFTTAQLNDVLQTLAAIDLGGGRISGAGYNSTTPVEQQLRSLPLSLGADPTAADFYSAVRGARVEVAGDGAPITGRILNVELRNTPAGKNEGEGAPLVEHHFLTVVSEAGTVRTVELSARTSVRLMDESLHGYVNRYLQILADNHKDGLRHLTLSDNGTGARELRVSYISEVPVWKSTYRILFDNRAGSGPKQATLQGWAVVDNTVGTDWNNVQLSLIAGAPQSFIQPISQPYYARRPEIGLPKEAQLEPQTHESGEASDMFAAPKALAQSMAIGNGSGGGLGSGRGSALGPGSGGNTGGGTYRVGGDRSPSASPQMVSYEDSASASVQVKTTTGGFDDFFEYKLTEPVTILKNQSALVPILQVKIEVDPVTLYSVRERTALRALWMRNSSTLTLDRGSFSILESGNFSGQGLLDPIHPGERRLLSYASDTAVHVSQQQGEGLGTHRTMRQITISRGVLTQKSAESDTREYLIRNAASDARTVIVEVPRNRGWDLQGAQPEEKTDDLYRYRVVVQPNASTTVRVVQQHTLATGYALVNTNAQQVDVLLKQSGGSADKLQASLQPLLQAKRNVATLDESLLRNRMENDRIAADQKRLRDNLSALKGSTEERALVKRYTQELNKQEDRLAALTTETSSLQTQRDAAQDTLTKAIEALEVTVDLT